MHCEKMEKIIGTTDDEKSSRSSYSITKFILPKLRILRLRYLPELKSISSAKLVCDSVERIDVWDVEDSRYSSLNNNNNNNNNNIFLHLLLYLSMLIILA